MTLTFDQVSLGYAGGPAILGPVSLRLGNGLFLLTGPNGSGKSSLLRSAAGILRPRAGRIRFADTDAWTSPLQYRWHVGYAPQDLLDLPTGLAREYLLYLAALKGIRPALQRERVAEVMALCNLPNGEIPSLSEGMRRRLVLAAALLNDPDLLLLDEPTSGLDPAERVSFRLLAADLAAERTVLLATHLLEEFEGLADGWFAIRDGRVI